MKEILEYEVIQAMHLYGGSFMKAWARLYETADLVNQRKLKAAFPEYWAEYTKLAEGRRIRTDK